MKQSTTVSGPVTIEIMEPKGVLFNPKREGLSVPRLDTLSGKTIALMSIQANEMSLSGSTLFFDILEEELRARYPDTRFIRCPSFGSPNTVINADEIAASCDGWIEGVKDAITQGRRDVGVYMERAGKPGVSICSDVLKRSKRALADINGMPAARLVSVPATAFCAAKRDPERMKKVVAGAVDDIVKTLTDPLTEEEKRSYEIEYDYSPKTFSGADYAEAYENFLRYCEKNVLFDGLPVVPPTREAVEWMLTGTSYPRDKVIGLMYPKSGIATVEKIAISAVMAGARPEYLPVIITLVETVTAEDFSQFHIVNEILPIIFISGPIIKELGLNNQVGYLSPGYRVNSTIGRALLMCMINIGWRDMTIYSAPGGPGRIGAYANYLIVENQEESPWESCAMFSRKGQLFTRFGMPTDARHVRHMIVLHPTMAHQIANAGFTKESFIRHLYDQNVIDYNRMTPEERIKFLKEISRENEEANSKMYVIRPEEFKPGLHREPFRTADQVLIMVAGSGAGNVLAFQTICGSTASNAEDVSKPRPYMSKVIRGAALTKYGR